MFIAVNRIIGTCGKETDYRFVNEDTLLDDFLRDVDLIPEGKL
jgi:hypothetical protein